MGEVTIIFNDANYQPELLNSVHAVEIKRNTIRVVGRGYNKIFFCDKVKSIETNYEVKVYVK